MAADKLPDTHFLRPWLNQIGYKESSQGAGVSIYHEDVLALCKLVDAHTKACVEPLRDKAMTLALEVTRLQDKIAEQVATNRDLIIENERLRRSVMQAAQYVNNTPMISPGDIFYRGKG